MSSWLDGANESRNSQAAEWACDSPGLDEGRDNKNEAEIRAPLLSSIPREVVLKPSSKAPWKLLIWESRRRMARAIRLSAHYAYAVVEEVWPDDP